MEILVTHSKTLLKPKWIKAAKTPDLQGQRIKFPPDTSQSEKELFLFQTLEIWGSWSC